MEEAINDRLKRIIEKSGLSVRAFAERIGTSQQSLFNYINGRDPNYSTIQSIATTFIDINIDWLITGNGSMLKSEQLSTIQQRLEHFIKSEEIQIPDFCKVIELPKSQFHNLNGNLSEFRIKKIIENYPQLNIGWLMSGEGTMLESVSSTATATDNSNDCYSSDTENNLVIENEVLKRENELLKEQLQRALDDKDKVMAMLDKALNK